MFLFGRFAFYVPVRVRFDVSFFGVFGSLGGHRFSMPVFVSSPGKVLVPVCFSSQSVSILFEGQFSVLWIHPKSRCSPRGPDNTG